LARAYRAYVRLYRPARRAAIPARNIRKLRVQHFRQIARRQFNIQPAFAAGNIDGVKFL
jgi:hypothetical protein